MLNHLDYSAQRFIINKFIRMDKLMDMLHIDYRVNANSFCPFHQNDNTPSAHFYDDSNLMWCFSEQKMYGSYDLYKVYTQINTEALALKILSKFPEEQQKQILMESQEEVEPEKLPFERSLEKFHKHSITIKELLKDISDRLEEEI